MIKLTFEQKIKSLNSKFFSQIIIILILFLLYASLAVSQDEKLPVETNRLELPKSQINFINPQKYDIEYIFESLS